MQIKDAIAKGTEIVAMYRQRGDDAGHCAAVLDEVMTELLPPAMLLVEAAEHAKRQNCVLAYCKEAGIFAAVTEPLLEGWVRVWTTNKQE